MPFTGAGMKSKYLAAITAIQQGTEDGTDKADAILSALFNAIADEIHQNARCSGVDVGENGGDTHDDVRIV